MRPTTEPWPLKRSLHTPLQQRSGASADQFYQLYTTTEPRIVTTPICTSAESSANDRRQERNIGRRLRIDSIINRRLTTPDNVRTAHAVFKWNYERMKYSCRDSTRASIHDELHGTRHSDRSNSTSQPITVQLPPATPPAAALQQLQRNLAVVALTHKNSFGDTDQRSDRVQPNERQLFINIHSTSDTTFKL